MNAEKLLQHFERLSEAPDAVPRLRSFILDLAVRGKLVEQDSDDEPAIKLLEQIQAEKAGKVKKEKLLPGLDKEELPFELPIGWVAVRFGDIYSLEYGDNLPAEKRSNTGEFPVYGSNGVVGSHSECFVKSPCIVVGRKGSAGALNLSLMSGCCVTDVAYYCVPPTCLDITFSFKLFHTLRLSNLGKGIKPGLNRNEVYAQPITIPPHGEQQRIVAKVDELMALCDELETAKDEREKRRDRLVAASLQRLSQPGDDEEVFRKDARFTFDHLPRLTTRPAHIKQLRQTILNLAVCGKLVPQDPKDEPATELLKRIQTEKARLIKEGKIRKQSQQAEINASEIPLVLPDLWTFVRLGDVIHLVSGQHLQPSEYSGQNQSGLPYVTGPADFGQNGLVIKRYAVVRKAVAQKGQILLTVKGAGVGKTAICDLLEVAISRQLMAMTAINWNHRFLLLTTHRLSETLKERARSLIPGISREDVEQFVFALPPLAEQRRILAKVNELMALCDQLEAQLSATSIDNRRLLEAVLNEALTPTRHEAMELINSFSCLREQSALAYMLNDNC